jgi:NADH-quinone oxidoreductase subunit C/D
MDDDRTEPQIVPIRENVNPLLEDEQEAAEGDSDTMFVNIGPHHPATHGVLHIETVLDGEQVLDLEPDIGYLHRCEEQMCQSSHSDTRSCPTPTAGTTRRT